MTEAERDQLVTASPDLTEEEEEDLYLLRRDFGIEPEDAYYRRSAWAMDLLANYRREEIRMMNAAQVDPDTPASERATRASADDLEEMDSLLAEAE